MKKFILLMLLSSSVFANTRAVYTADMTKFSEAVVFGSCKATIAPPTSYEVVFDNNGTFQENMVINSVTYTRNGTWSILSLKQDVIRMTYNGSPAEVSTDWNLYLTDLGSEITNACGGHVLYSPTFKVLTNELSSIKTTGIGTGPGTAKGLLSTELYGFSYVTSTYVKGTDKMSTQGVFTWN